MVRNEDNVKIAHFEWYEVPWCALSWKKKEVKFWLDKHINSTYNLLNLNGCVKRLIKRGQTYRLIGSDWVWSEKGKVWEGQICSKASQPLTCWRVKDRHDQQARITARHHSHSHPEEPRTSMINRLELQQCTTATHMLWSQDSRLEMQQGTPACQPLTHWRAKKRDDQQARIALKHYSHTHPREWRTNMINGLELQQDTTATHKLKFQGQVWSAG